MRWKFCGDHGCDDCMDISIADDIRRETYPPAGFYKGKFLVGAKNEKRGT